MKIKLKIEAFGFKPGSVIEVSPTRAKELLKDGDAVEVVETPKAKRGTRKNLENKSLSAAG